MKILRTNHINHIASDYAVTLAHYQDLLGAQFLMKIGHNDYTDGCLVDVGGEIFELLIPKIQDKAEGRQLQKYGPHYSSVEIYVPDLAEARAAVVGRGIRLLIDGHADFLTVGSDTRGVIVQVYDGNWHAEDHPGTYENPKRTAAWWRDEHPIGYTGMRHLSFATDDLEGSRDFWLELTGGRELYREPRPDANAEAIGLEIGLPVELIAPVGDGPVARFIETYGTKIRATTFGVVDIERTRAYFAGKGITLQPGDIPGSLMLAAEDNRGAILQFVA